MTSRNLNKTWRDIVFEQYEADYVADVPFRIRYLIYGDQWRRNIIIEIPTKINVPVFRQALLHAASSRRLENDPAYEDDLIKVRARIPPSVQNSNDAHLQNDSAVGGNSG
ncbi:Ff.00g066630.m01.CDS01 [Fusarium sp. VM40]|nr:Ff.00g066630.m01.CDS01 [Fusarium sp. VM40]